MVIAASTRRNGEGLEAFEPLDIAADRCKGCGLADLAMDSDTTPAWALSQP